MECPSCHADTVADSRFCIECGAALPVLCPSCNHANPERARFCAKCGYRLSGTSPNTVAPVAPPALLKPAHSFAERRQLTVMFCDLVGSTELASRLDPEDLRDLIGSYHERVTETVIRFGGYVAKYMGDGVLIYFGYPAAHEEDAERAVRAGLALVDAVTQLQASEPLRVRVGIATGLVVVGDLVGSGAAQERAVVGETPNLAARLQTVAEPGSVVIAASTRHLTGGLFEYEDLGAVEAKGFSEPVRAWRVRGESALDSRYEALRSGETPLVGRAEEIELLQRRWRRAKSGEGQVVLLVGEPGVGKSRLIAELQDALKFEPHVRLRYFYSPHYADSALRPIVLQLEKAAGFRPSEGPEGKWAKLEAMLALTATSDEDVALLADLLSLPHDDRRPLPDLTPQRKKEKTFAALMRQLEQLTREQPVLMVFEDVHWVDPSSRELLELTIERVQHLPVLLMVTFRPEFIPPWTGLAHVTLLTLNRIGRRDAAAMIEQLAGGKSLPPAVVEQIMERTDGVPLFVEELTKTVLESRLLSETPDGYVLVGPLPPLAIPTTLQASLLARLDRLAAVKDVAQTASVIGREFAHPLIAAVAALPEADLRRALDELVEAQLIFRRGTPPDATYTFKHALVQDAAYGSLLRSRRQQLHQRVAWALETQFPPIAEAEPEVLARHQSEAGLVDDAALNWERAGRRALGRSAQPEAVAHLREAVKLVGQLPSSTRRDEREVALLLSLGQALFGARGGANPETAATFARAKELAMRSGDPDAVRRASYGMFISDMIAGHIDQVFATGTELASFAEQTNDDETRMVAGRILGGVHALAGDLLIAEQQLRNTIELSRLTPALVLHGDTFAHNPGKTALATLSHVRWSRGFPEHAQQLAADGLRMIDQRSEPNTAGFLMVWAGILRLLTREPERALLHAQDIDTFAEERGSRFWQTVGEWIRGAALVEQGHLELGLARLTSVFARFAAMGGRQHEPFFRCFEARAYLRLGRSEDCEDCLERAHRCIAETGQRFYEPGVHIESAALVRHQGRYDEAEARLLRAIEVARCQESKSWELRAATNLAQLWCDQGRRDEANSLLATIYAWFAEGAGSRDLKEAKTLLSAIQSSQSRA
ncbi:Double zinc ribbon [Rhizobiales bacterium GAS191]|nr:Double zinc ribbon [Rhizobiales bacterium GAS191]